MNLKMVDGDLLDQPVEVIVNAWNRNIIPWWLLLPQGVSGAIKRRAGTAPFRELAKHGAIPLGGAVLTGAGRLPFKGIIHVAGINMIWRASERSIRDSVTNAIRVAQEHGFGSIAFPIIGAGSGGGATAPSVRVGDDAGRTPMKIDPLFFQSAAKAVNELINQRPQSPTVDEIAMVMQDTWYKSPPIILAEDRGRLFNTAAKREAWRQALRRKG